MIFICLWRDRVISPEEEDNWKDDKVHEALDDDPISARASGQHPDGGDGGRAAV